MNGLCSAKWVSGVSAQPLLLLLLLLLQYLVCALGM